MSTPNRPLSARDVWLLPLPVSVGALALGVALAAFILYPVGSYAATYGVAVAVIVLLSDRIALLRTRALLGASTEQHGPMLYRSLALQAFGLLAGPYLFWRTVAILGVAFGVWEPR